ILVVCLQEVAPIAYSFLGGSHLRPYLDKFRDAVQLAAAAKLDGAASYVPVISRNVGMTALMVFVPQGQTERIKWLRTAEVGVGLWEMGNKGAVGVRLGYAASSTSGEGLVELTFVAAHLAPMEWACERRNRDWADVVRGLVFEPVSLGPPRLEMDREGEATPLLATTTAAAKDGGAGVGPYPSSSFEGAAAAGIYTPTTHLFLAGDLNYRTASTAPSVMDQSRFPQPCEDDSYPRHYWHLLSSDQLTAEMRAGRTCHGLREAPVEFPPTYKYSDVARWKLNSGKVNAEGMDGEGGRWDWAKHRWPSWCDRVLYLDTPPWVEKDAPAVQVKGYHALPLMATSDHRPVACALSIPARPIPEPTPTAAAEVGGVRCHPPFSLNPYWKQQRKAARRLELVVGVAAYLTTTREAAWILSFLVFVLILLWCWSSYKAKGQERSAKTGRVDPLVVHSNIYLRRSLPERVFHPKNIKTPSKVRTANSPVHQTLLEKSNYFPVMESPPRPSSTSLFQVYLRLRPPPSPLVQLTPQSLYPNLPPPERYLTVEPAVQDVQDGVPTHITIRPPSDSRKRAVEKFAFTKVFEEHAEQIEIFKGTGVMPLVEGVLAEGRDGLVATLGVTGSGKVRRHRRGLTQLSLDLLYRSLATKILQPSENPSLVASLSAADPSEAQILSAHAFLEHVYGDAATHGQNTSRAQTPMVGYFSPYTPVVPPSSGPKSQWSILSLGASSPKASSSTQVPGGAVDPTSVPVPQISANETLPQAFCLPFWKPRIPKMRRSQAKVRFGNDLQDPTTYTSSVPKRKMPQRPSALPQFPDIRDLSVAVDSNAEYAVVISMYEVYNDRIFDLLSVPSNQKDLRRRALLFKSTEASPDRKVVAGLRKIVCGSYEEALMVLETGLMERRVAGTGSNSVSSRSHGFFCVEVKKRRKAPRAAGASVSWSGAQLTAVDLAGSERARNAKTAGATLAEAGKINESLMYLGQCLQMQSDSHDSAKPSLVPFRQCKLTELLFSNSFPSVTHNHHQQAHQAPPHRNPQKAIMIVTADPLGDFNATSQILRYSALAREVTVPRIPSVSSTILAGVAGRVPSGRTSPSATTTNGTQVDEGVVEMAFSEIARLNEELELLTIRLADEERRRKEAEKNWQRAEDRAEAIEMEVREDCWSVAEQRMEEERRRWKGAWDEEADRNDEHLDRKLEIFSQSIRIHEDQTVDQQQPDTYQENDELEAENETLLRRKLKALQEEQCQSPTRKSATTATRKASTKLSPDLGDGSSRDDDDDILSSSGSALFNKLNGTRLSSNQRIMADGQADLKMTPGTAARKMRKLTTRKWDLMDEDEMDAYENF
ncbi:MAG: hypothetical protein Q9163_005853, partial [Psora crenata]